MHTRNLDPWGHTHEFAIVDSGNERRTAFVAGVTAATMVVEVVAGFAFGSMALLADGWHMGTHVAALAISDYAYRYAKRHAEDPRFTFGTGKVGVLGGFTSAVALAVVAFLVGIESVQRFFARSSIQFDQAIFVAVIGFLVNVVSALILRRQPFHPHGVEFGHRHLNGFRHLQLYAHSADARMELVPWKLDRRNYSGSNCRSDHEILRLGKPKARQVVGADVVLVGGHG